MLDLATGSLVLSLLSVLRRELKYWLTSPLLLGHFFKLLLLLLIGHELRDHCTVMFKFVARIYTLTKLEWFIDYASRISEIYWNALMFNTCTIKIKVTYLITFAYIYIYIYMCVCVCVWLAETRIPIIYLITSKSFFSYPLGLSVCALLTTLPINFHEIFRIGAAWIILKHFWTDWLRLFCIPHIWCGVDCAFGVFLFFSVKCNANHVAVGPVLWSVFTRLCESVNTSQNHGDPTTVSLFNTRMRFLK